MTGQHRMPASIRRPPHDYPRYSGPFIAVAVVNGAVLLFGAVFAVGTTIAPRVHAAAREPELAELGPNLRAAVETRLQRSEVVKLRLAWPHEPDFDRRAFEKSGFDDPIGMELL